MNGVHRFLSRREKKPKANNGEGTSHGPLHPTKDVNRILHNADDKEKRKTDKDEEKKIKEIQQRLHEEGIKTVKDGQVEDALRLPSVNGKIEDALSLLKLFNEAAHGRIREPSSQVKLVGAVNRENVTCYLDSLLFSMFAKNDSFENVLSADFPDEPRKKLATLLRLWVNMLRSGKLITTDITQKLQESLKACGWPEAALLRQQDVSEAFTFITGKLDLPLLTLKMDVYHTGKEDRDDHRIVRERLLDVAIPPPSEDGTPIRLEDCLEQYFNNKIEVKRHLQRRNTVQTFRPNEKEVGVETVEVIESPSETQDSDPFTARRPVEFRRRADSIFTKARVENAGDGERRTLDDIDLNRGSRQRAGTMRREVLMPAWQFFSLIPWYSHDHFKGPKDDRQVVVHLQTKRPVLGICLKRYSMTAKGVGSRLDTYIDIPLEIGVPHFISDDCGHGSAGYEPNFTNFKLSLLAVICHRGKSLDAGHYISLVRDPEIPQRNSEENHWLRFDDLAQQRITTVDIYKALKDECPYLLFYQVRPIDEDEYYERGSPPSYDEATTADNSNNELSRVNTQNDSAQASNHNASNLPSDVSQETLVSTANTTSTDPPAVTVIQEVAPEPITTVVSDPEAHTKSNGDTLTIDVKDTRSKSIDIAGLAPDPLNDEPKASLDIPRGRTSFQDNRSSITGTTSDNELSVKGGASAPITPGDESRTSFLGSSRRNSVTKGFFKPRSRPQSLVAENRLSFSMNRLKNAMSKDKLESAGVHSDTVTVIEISEEKKIADKEDIPRRSKSLRHRKGKRSSSIGKILDGDMGSGKAKKVPERECIIM